jgi:hypothetical protein
MKVKTSELTGNALDCAVHIALHGACEGYAEHEYSTDWAQGGPIIEREGMTIALDAFGWQARHYDGESEPWIMTGPTPLIAAMRCYVASELGDEVEIPEELA